MSGDRDQSLLGLHAGFDRADVLAAYRTQARVLHPDTGGSDEQMVRLTEARDRLVAAFDDPPPDVGEHEAHGFERTSFDPAVAFEDRDEAKLRFYLVPLVLFPVFVVLLVALANTIAS